MEQRYLVNREQFTEVSIYCEQFLGILCFAGQQTRVFGMRLNQTVRLTIDMQWLQKWQLFLLTFFLECGIRNLTNF